MKPFSDPARFLQFAALVTPPLAVVAPMSLAVVLPVAALAAGLAAWRRGALTRPPPGPAFVILGALAWGGASALWALEPGLVKSVWLQIAGLAIAGLVLLGVAPRLEDDHRTAIGTALALGIVLALAILCIEWASDRLFETSLVAAFRTRHPFTFSVFNRGVATLALLVWPAALAVWRRHGVLAAASLILVTFMIITQFNSMAAIVSIGAGLTVGAGAFWRPRLVARVLAAVMVLVALAAPVVPRLPVVDDLIQYTSAMVRPGNGIISIVHRLAIWQFAAETAAARPIAGWGLNASRALSPKVEPIDPIQPSLDRLPLHPHNALLQLWIELGAVGAALGTGLAILAFLGAAELGRPPPDPIRPAALATTASAVAVALVGYGIWQGWWMAALWLTAGFMAAVGGRRGAEPPPRAAAPQA